MDFALAAGLLSVLMYLMMRTRRMKMRLVEREAPRVKRNLIIIKHSFDEEVAPISEPSDEVPCAVSE